MLAHRWNAFTHRTYVLTDIADTPRVLSVPIRSMTAERLSIAPSKARKLSRYHAIVFGETFFKMDLSRMNCSTVPPRTEGICKKYGRRTSNTNHYNG
jgi:hypothetical protein